MKKVLLASTVLAMSATVAAAEVTVGGNGRMGVTYTEGATNEFAFTSRIRISFAASGETDGGLSFGGSIRADNSVGGAAGTAGSIFVSGAFGKLTMGDVDGAAEFAVGDLAGVGLTGVGDYNENAYLSNSGAARRSALRYEYSAGSLSFAVSADNPGTDVRAGAFDGLSNTYAVGVKYSMDGYSFGLGYETTDVYDAGTGTNTNIDHIIVGGEATFSGVTLKATYGTSSDLNFDQYGISAAYSADGMGLTAFYRVADFGAADIQYVGVGASYDLGGGASVVGGISNANPSVGTSQTMADFGLSFSF